jgi:hypothetical protein
MYLVKKFEFWKLSLQTYIWKNQAGYLFDWRKEVKMSICYAIKYIFYHADIVSRNLS